MNTTTNDKAKCEFCEQNFQKNQLTESFNRIYNHICLKCKDYINSRIDPFADCSEYCKQSGKCDGSC